MAQRPLHNEAVAPAVFMTLVADVIALAKHSSMWISAASRNRLLAWLGILAALLPFAPEIAAASGD